MSSVRLSLEGEVVEPRAIVTEVLTPEVEAFEMWFSDKERGDGPLTRLERELLLSYLWWATQVKK